MKNQNVAAVDPVVAVVALVVPHVQTVALPWVHAVVVAHQSEDHAYLDHDVNAVVVHQPEK